MRRKAFTLLAAVAVLLIAAGGASAAELTEPEELAPEDDSANGDAEVGICVVGADSPCNGEDAKDAAGEPITNNDSGENEMWIPEDQNRDGEIDDRFGGDNCKELNKGDDSEHNQMWIPEDQNRDGEIDDRFAGDSSKELNGDDDSEESQIWIPEDQNRDGEIDDRFLGNSPDSLTAIISGILGLF